MAKILNLRAYLGALEALKVALLFNGLALFASAVASALLLKRGVALFQMAGKPALICGLVFLALSLACVCGIKGLMALRRDALFSIMGASAQDLAKAKPLVILHRLRSDPSCNHSKFNTKCYIVNSGSVQPRDIQSVGPRFISQMQPDDVIRTLRFCADSGMKIDETPPMDPPLTEVEVVLSAIQYHGMESSVARALLSCPSDAGSVLAHASEHDNSIGTNLLITLVNQAEKDGIVR